VKGKKILPPCSVCFFLRELETREVLGTTTKKWGTGGLWKKGEGGKSSLLVRQKERI